MPQTVFDVGDPITSRLNLGVTPDGTTSVTFTVKRPDGTVISGLNASAFVGDEKTVQWWATDDGTASGTTLAADGDWLIIWSVTGTGASVTAKVYPVRPLPTSGGSRVPWTPFLSDVADYIPYLTTDSLNPATQLYLGTFTGNTVPSDEQVQRVVDREVAIVQSLTSGPWTMPPTLYSLAKTVVALRAASIIARTYPRTNTTDLRFADTLDAWAQSALTSLVEAVGEQGGGPGAGPAPVGFFPVPDPKLADNYL